MSQPALPTAAVAPAHGLVPAFVLERHARGETSGSMRAATLFADVSGFTALSGQLMSLGNEGAEALARALRFYFDPLVEAVHDAGGTIVGIAGDGISAFFPAGAGALDEERAAGARAVAAAVAMRAVLERHPDYSLPAVRTRFGIKVGLSSGAVHWSIVAPPCSHRSFWFAGEAIDGAAAAENDATAGEIVLDLELRTLLGVATATPPDARFGRLAAEHDRLSAAGPRSREGSEAGATDIAAFVPAAVLRAPSAGEFRDALRVFVGVDPAADHDAVFPWLLDLVDAYGGYASHPDFGDKGPNLFVLFGAPVAHEDDVPRGLRFVLEALASPCARGLRAGITFGGGYAGFNGGRGRCEYTCLGSATNRAAHMMTVTPWGEAYADDALQARARADFDMEARGSVELKGGPTALHQLLRHRRRRRLAGREIVGRLGEIAALEAMLEPLRRGEPAGVIHVDGEAGIGKSVLVAELRQRLREWKRPVRFLEAPCDPVLRPSLHPLAQMLRDLMGFRPGEAPEDRRQKLDGCIDAVVASLPSSSPERGATDDARAMLGAIVNVRWEGSAFELAEPSARLGRVLQGLATFLAAIARLEPVILLVEDGHALDGDSLSALQHLGAVAARCPLAILVAARPGDDGTPMPLELPEGVPRARLALGSLARAELGDLATRELGHRPADELLDRLERTTAGNPFFAEQVIAHLRETGQLGTVALSGAPSLPGDVKAVLVARIDRLSAELKETVQAAAVIGRQFEIGLLSAALGGDPTLPERVRQAAGERIWSALDDLHYLFRHALLRDAAYDMLARSRLRELHRACALAVEALHGADREEHLASLAHHWELGGDVVRAREYLLAAARRAAASFAHDDAERAYRRFLALQGPPGALDYEAWRELAGKVLVVRGRHAEAHEALTRALEVARALADPARQADTMGELGYVRMMSGSFEEARRILEEALVLARRAGYRLGEGVARAYLGILFKHQGRHALARPLFGEALSAFRSAGNRYWEGIALTHLASLLDDDATDEVTALHEQALSIAREVGSPRNEAFALASLALLHYQRGDLDRAGELATATLEIHRRHGNRTLESVWLSNFAAARWEAGESEGVADDLRRAIEIHRALGDRAYEARTSAALGIVHRDEGDLGRARELLAHAAVEHRALGNELQEGRCELALALVAARAGHPAPAALEAILAKVRRSGRPSDVGRALVEAAEIARLGADGAAAEEMLREARRLVPEAFVAERLRLELECLALERLAGREEAPRLLEVRRLAALIPEGPLRARVP